MELERTLFLCPSQHGTPSSVPLYHIAGEMGRHFDKVAILLLYVINLRRGAFPRGL